jgi:hypothetical protein
MIFKLLSFRFKNMYVFQFFDRHYFEHCAFFHKRCVFRQVKLEVQTERFKKKFFTLPQANPLYNLSYRPFFCYFVRPFLFLILCIIFTFTVAWTRRKC